MNHTLIVKATNRIALYATVVLFYWVVVFLTITVFDLKIFRGHMTETFYLSILGIFAILGGSIVLNVMSNLSRISESVSIKEEFQEASALPSKYKTLMMVLSVPIIVCLLFSGNALSAKKKKELLISSASAMVSENQKELGVLAAYEFSNAYIENAGKILSVMEKIDRNFPDVKIILPDNINEKKVFLAFQSYEYDFSKKSAEKQSYIYSASKEIEHTLKVFYPKET